MSSVSILEAEEVRPIAPTLIRRMGFDSTEMSKAFDVNKIINNALDSLPPGKTVAILGYYDIGSKNIRGAAVKKLGDNWSLMGVLEHQLDSGKPLEGLVAVRAAW